VIQSDRPNKKIFSITETGKKEFMNWLAEGAGEEATQLKSSFLMKFFWWEYFYFVHIPFILLG